MSHAIRSCSHIQNPDPDFVRLLNLSQAISTQTSGAFDITVQSLWELYSNHYQRGFENNIGDIPPNAALAEARAVMGMHNLKILPDLQADMSNGLHRVTLCLRKSLPLLTWLTL